MILSIATVERTIDAFDGPETYDMEYAKGSPIDLAIKVVESLVRAEAAIRVGQAVKGYSR